jgi:hypothetical protein
MSEKEEMLAKARRTIDAIRRKQHENFENDIMHCDIINHGLSLLEDRVKAGLAEELLEKGYIVKDGDSYREVEQ